MKFFFIVTLFIFPLSTQAREKKPDVDFYRAALISNISTSTGGSVFNMDFLVGKNFSNFDFDNMSFSKRRLFSRKTMLDSFHGDHYTYAISAYYLSKPVTVVCGLLVQDSEDRSEQVVADECYVKDSDNDPGLPQGNFRLFWGWLTLTKEQVQNSSFKPVAKNNPDEKLGSSGL